jgi:hypothetical protein
MLKTALLATVLAVAAAPAAAQPLLLEPPRFTPDQLLHGIVRGLEAENSSGQVGEFVIFPRTRQIAVTLNGTAGKLEAVTINRGGACGPSAGPPVATLGTLRRGRLTAMSPLPVGRLLSGNYNVVVHNNVPSSAVVACGHVYLR